MLMATTDAVSVPRQRLERALQTSLEDGSLAQRLACLLAGRVRFRARVGSAPGGTLDDLPPPFEDLDIPPTASEAQAELLTGLENGPGDPSRIADGYEARGDTDHRNALGQYFTPEPVADALVAWALDGVQADDPPPRVLDPAVGTGTFLRSAFDHLRNRFSARPPTALLQRLIGVDVDGIALHLAGLQLAAAAGCAAPETLPLHHGSFFDCHPGDTATGGPSLQSVDAVVGNPPFVRAEALDPNIAHYREHLAAFGEAGASPLLDGDDALSRRSDAYVYFVTQATRFLRPGGRLALVLPTKWLMSAYGEDLRRFLRERYRINAVVGFDGQAFADAVVDTALLLAERDPGADPGAPIKFLRLAEPPDPDRFLAAIAGQAHGTPSVERPQRSLTASGSLARYLAAPADLLALFDGPPFVPLEELAEVARGTMTGANRFFFIEAADIDRFGIEPEFRRRAVKSLRSIARPAVGGPELERWLVDVHPLVETVRAEIAEDTALEPAVKEALRDRGATGLGRYIDHAEAEGWHEGRSCQSRAVWFNLGPLRAPAAFVPKLLRERVFAIRNEAEAVPSNAIDGVWPDEDVHTGALLAVLNASAGKAAMEVTGRDEAGMLQLMTYETASLPSLDVRTISSTAAANLTAAGDAYATDPTPTTMAALDRAVDAAFDLPMAPERLRELAVTLKQTRVNGGERLAEAAD